MATSRSINHRNQVSNSLPSEIRHGHSKAQMCLMKILRTISVSSPSNPPYLHEGLEFGIRNEDRALFCEEIGFRIDLNIRLCPPPEVIESPADGEVFQNLCRSDSIKVVTNDNGEESEVVEVEDTHNVQFQSSELEINGVLQKTISEEECQIETQTQTNHEHKQFRRGARCLDLLIEAAKLISGGFTDDESEPERLKFVEEVVNKSAGVEPAAGESANSRGLKRNYKCWPADPYGNFENTSPVVRSKRGRSQVLPYKYRDSILEPLARLSRHRSTTLSSKRRSR